MHTHNLFKYVCYRWSCAFEFNRWALAFYIAFSNWPNRSFVRANPIIHSNWSSGWWYISNWINCANTREAKTNRWKKGACHSNILHFLWLHGNLLWRFYHRTHRADCTAQMYVHRAGFQVGQFKRAIQERLFNWPCQRTIDIFLTGCCASKILLQIKLLIDQ